VLDALRIIAAWTLSEHGALPAVVHDEAPIRTKADPAKRVAVRERVQIGDRWVIRHPAICNDANVAASQLFSVQPNKAPAKRVHGIFPKILRNELGAILCAGVDDNRLSPERRGEKKGGGADE
jgi:hypothetical protein